MDIPLQNKSLTEVAWSHSALRTYENCPHRYAREKVVKDCKDPGTSKALVWGNEVHNSLEHRLKSGTALPSSVAQYEPWAQKVEGVAAAMGASMEVEAEMCLTNKWTPTSWFGKKAWYRVKADVKLTSEATRSAIVFDWKTGKYWGDDGQAARNAAMVFQYNSNIDTVATAFVYLQQDKVDRQTFERSQLKELLTPSLQTLNDISRSYRSGNWPKKASGLCRFCPVADCENNPNN